MNFDKDFRTMYDRDLDELQQFAKEEGVAKQLRGKKPASQSIKKAYSKSLNKLGEQLEDLGSQLQTRYAEDNAC